MLSKGKEVFMGAIWEKRGWIADSRGNMDAEIKYFKKAASIYNKNPKALEIEGHKNDRLLTVEHFVGKALYFRGKKSDLKESIKLFTNSLEGYKKLKSNDAIAFNYSWLARALISDGKLKEAKLAAKKSVEYFNRAAKKQGDQLKTYAFRIKAELASAEGKEEEAIRNSLEALRYTLPSGAYYNGVLEAIKPIVKSVNV